MYLDDTAAAVTSFETEKSWMYLDSKSLVTCAIGEMIPTVAVAATFPFHRFDGSLASLGDVRDEYQRVKSMPAGYVAEYYHSPKSLVLPHDWMQKRLLNRLQQCVIDLQLLFGTPFFNALPDPAKCALVDMDYNLGPGRTVPKPTGIREYVHMLDAIRAHDFIKASALCDRDAGMKAFAARNLWTRNQFLAAAKAWAVVVPPPSIQGAITA